MDNNSTSNVIGYKGSIFNDELSEEGKLLKNIYRNIESDILGERLYKRMCQLCLMHHTFQQNKL